MDGSELHEQGLLFVHWRGFWALGSQVADDKKEYRFWWLRTTVSTQTNRKGSHRRVVCTDSPRREYSAGGGFRLFDGGWLQNYLSGKTYFAKYQFTPQILAYSNFGPPKIIALSRETRAMKNTQEVGRTRRSNGVVNTRIINMRPIVLLQSCSKCLTPGVDKLSNLNATKVGCNPTLTAKLWSRGATKPYWTSWLNGTAY